MKKILVVVFTGILLLCRFIMQAQVTIHLHKGWQFREVDEAQWHAATVPGEVHTDLLHNKLIADPFYRDNEKKMQWIEKEDWEYRTRFDVPESIFNKKQIELVFEGLDTYAEVYLNGRLLFAADNMFREWKVAVKPLIKRTGNTLHIIFRSAQNKADSLMKADIPYVIPDNPRAYVRKAQYHFGWDWGPKLTGCGIWKPVKLTGYDILAPEEEYQPPVTARLVEEKDEKGAGFYLEINGKPVYMKGANYIPADAFVTRVTKDDYRKILISAKEANMNMIRVWGGGIYEDDYFYELCDSLGLYVWQDFMFAGAMVPGDAAFFDNVREEVYHQVKRLRKYKSVVLWCGNNEIEEAFFRWGWQTSFRINPADSAKLWHDYVRLFHDSIPAWIKRYDPYRPYVTTSPKYPWGNPQSFVEGDSHYWGVWWGVEDFEIFEQKTGRFVSEYGMQAMPGYSSWLRITQPQDRYMYSDVVKLHQKANAGYDKLEAYMQRYIFPKEKIAQLSLKDYTYLTQCVQYYGFKNMILIHRSKEPYNMGTLLWQLNDCWPVASWSITDYYNRAPRAAWYAVKNAYSDNPPARDMVRPINLSLTNPGITWFVKNNELTITATAFAKYVFIDIPDLDGKLADNYFDLQAGEKKIVKIEGKFKKGSNISVISLYDIYEKYGKQ